MSAVEIFTPGQTSVRSKIFRVEPGIALVISSFNLGCAVSNDVGDVTTPADCAVLHKLELSGGNLPTVDGCVTCVGCVLDGVDFTVQRSEPVVQCGELWTHNAENNLSVLSVPGFYMFELCSEQNIGSISIKVEELTAEQAKLIPKPLFHGEC